MPGGIVAPDFFPTRDPRDETQQHGRIVNPVRYMEVGGLYTASKWHGNFSIMRNGSGPTRNDMEVKRATNVKAAHSSTGKND